MTTECPVPLVERLTRLAPRPESARLARRTVTEVLDEAGRPDLVDAAGLLVSELVTNAIVHARTAIALGVVAGPTGIRVTVHDGSPHRPSPRHYDRGASTGRGLELIDLMSDRHGTDTDPVTGKTVWFELGTGLPERPLPDTAGAAPADSLAGTHSVDVVLVGVPTVLAMAWRQHVDALLREHLLAQWEDADDAASEAVGAADGLAHDAFARLADALGDLPAAAGSTARSEVALRVTAAEAAAFAALSELLDGILLRAEQGHMLAPATQPEIQLLRRWMCDEVCRQADGGPATAWPGLPTELEAPRVPGPSWDASQVRRATAAVVAADDVNRILAASPAALELLGWDESLFGRRIGAIIPERLREAHIAGFTLHLLTGASAILDVEVEVPALRRDGTELPVLLLVHRELSADGRPVFMATLREA